MSAFVQAVQTANMASLVDVMDEELVTFIRILLAEQEAATAEADVLRRFAEAYLTLEEADLQKAVRASARQSGAEAPTTNPSAL